MALFVVLLSSAKSRRNWYIEKNWQIACQTMHVGGQATHVFIEAP